VARGVVMRGRIAWPRLAAVVVSAAGCGQVLGLGDYSEAPARGPGDATTVFDGPADSVVGDVALDPGFSDDASLDVTAESASEGRADDAPSSSGADSSGSGSGSSSSSGSGSSSGSDSGGSSGSDSGGSSGGLDSGPTVEAGEGGGSSSGGPITGGLSYEAEAPVNVLFGTALRLSCAPTCPPSPPQMDGDACCSAGTDVRHLLGARRATSGALQFNGVSAPSNGMYQTTWYYFCGLNQTDGDLACGVAPGCRAAQFIVNGAVLPVVWQFPCFSTPWSIVHTFTMSLPLKAGSNNSIKIYSDTTDTVDVDRIVVALLPSGPTDGGGD
jgi:hypothetical protein